MASTKHSRLQVSCFRANVRRLVHHARRTHAVVACLLLISCCSSATALEPLSRQLLASTVVARRGRHLRTTLPPAAQYLAALRAGNASVGEAATLHAVAVAERAETASVSGGAGGGASPTATAQATAADKAALTAVFNAAQLPIPANKPNPCSWPGVTCAANGAVVALNLTSGVSPLLLPPTPRLCNLTARETGGKAPVTLAPSIGQLKDLVDLSMKNLWLAGAVPPSISQLTKLTSLVFDDNCFAGSVPPGFFRLRNLAILFAARNFFSGGLPQRRATYASLSSLGMLDFGVNLLSGPIPAALAALPSLSGLLLNTNRLSGSIPPALLRMYLSGLVLDRNRLSGDLSGYQINAGIIGLSRNRLAGNFNKIKFSDYVSLIDASDNIFSGSFPQILCTSSGIQSLDLSRNRLTGSVPANCFAQSSNQMLNAIFLKGNNLSGSLQPFSRVSKSILALEVSQNKFTGRIPQALGALPKLNWLGLGGNLLTGIIPAFCQGNQRLFYLYLHSNALTGPPTPLSSPSCSSSLLHLYLSSNRLSGAIPATISSFKSLRTLLLDKNAFTGVTPSGISGMAQLKGLGLSYNQLRGKIPASWPGAIRQVLLAGNRLSGVIPAALSKLKRASFKPGNPNLCGTPLPACK